MSRRARRGREEGEEEEEARGSQARRRSPQEPAASGGRSQGRHERKRKKQEAQQLQKLQHLESFYEKPPPGLIKENETKPEDCIPDVPGNESAREFLAHAPTKGLWMPLGKEVKVMQCKAENIPDVIGPSYSHLFTLWGRAGCLVDSLRDPGWRCKRYGHRTGDKECPFFIKGNQKLEQFRVAHEDPMYDIIRETKRHEKEMRIQQLKQLLEDSTSDDNDSSDDSDEDDEDSNSSASSECRDKHKKKKRKKEKKKKEKKKKKKRKHKSSKCNEKLEAD
ncbi:retinitis pigmentosa 9 protein isoform X2 [Anser cygnoides]|uniref:retinitis pigmentosa 9 protein isoform X2 n=1 Tax=Anser cygnoides TaxID=8845 RepID=UPI0034D2E060